MKKLFGFIKDYIRADYELSRRVLESVSKGRIVGWKFTLYYILMIPVMIVLLPFAIVFVEMMYLYTFYDDEHMTHKKYWKSIIERVMNAK